MLTAFRILPTRQHAIIATTRRFILLHTMVVVTMAAVVVVAAAITTAKVNKNKRYHPQKRTLSNSLKLNNRNRNSNISLLCLSSTCPRASLLTMPSFPYIDPCSAFRRQKSVLSFPHVIIHHHLMKLFEKCLVLLNPMILVSRRVFEGKDDTGD